MRPGMPPLPLQLQPQGHLPTDPKALHNTGIPSIYHVRWSGASSKGSSLYDCPFGSACGTPPYVGDLPSCGSHVRRVHIGSSILCPYCPNRHYYNADNWWKHMRGEHRDAPWCIALVPATPSPVTTMADTTKPPPFSTFTALLYQPLLIKKQLLKIPTPMYKRRTMSSFRNKLPQQKSGYSLLKITRRMLLGELSVPCILNSPKMKWSNLWCLPQVTHANTITPVMPIVASWPGTEKMIQKLALYLKP